MCQNSGSHWYPKIPEISNLSGEFWKDGVLVLVNQSIKYTVFILT